MPALTQTEAATIVATTTSSTTTARPTSSSTRRNNPVRIINEGPVTHRRQTIRTSTGTRDATITHPNRAYHARNLEQRRRNLEERITDPCRRRQGPEFELGSPSDDNFVYDSDFEHNRDT